MLVEDELECRHQGARMPILRARWLQGTATVLVVVAGFVHAGAASGQTTTTPAPSTTPTTVPVTSTTVPPTTTPPSTSTVTTASATPTTTTAPATTATTSGDDFPWLAVVAGVVALAAIMIGITAASRRRARRHAAMDSWRHRAADETAEIGAAARLLAGGTPVSAAIAQQTLASLRALEDLAQSAPDERGRAAMQEAHQAVRALALAIDAEHSARRAQPPVPPEQLDAAAAGLRATAADADRVLRATNREVTEAS
jgi:hypothetical protein